MVAGAVSPSARGGRLARGALALVLPVGCVALIVLFAVALFPYDRFRDAAESQLGALAGAEVRIAELSGGLSVAGIALKARDATLRWPDGTALQIERARVRPAWSLSWLRGNPALALDVHSSLGRVKGTWWPGASGGFTGRASGVELAQLPPVLLGGPSPFEGRADAEIQLRLEGGAPRGSVAIEAGEGSLAGANIPMAIPYERLVGEAHLGDGGAIELRDVALEGPMVAATAGGTIGAAPSLALAPLDLDLELEVVDPNLRPVVARGFGVRVDGDGLARLRITGSPTRPVVR